MLDILVFVGAFRREVGALIYGPISQLPADVLCFESLSIVKVWYRFVPALISVFAVLFRW